MSLWRVRKIPLWGIQQFGQFMTDHLSLKCRNVLKFSIHSAKYGFLNNPADDHFIVIKLQKWRWHEQCCILLHKSDLNWTSGKKVLFVAVPNKTLRKAKGTTQLLNGTEIINNLNKDQSSINNQKKEGWEACKKPWSELNDRLIGWNKQWQDHRNMTKPFGKQRPWHQRYLASLNCLYMCRCNGLLL